MESQFYTIYDELYERYRRRDGRPPVRGRRDYRSLSLITRAIEVASADAGVTRRLRPDARYFLLTAIDQMIVAPLQHPESGHIAEEVLIEDLTSDLQTILGRAADSSRDEISGHDVVNALASSWEKLRTTGREIWG
jgi:hypothetical protein